MYAFRKKRNITGIRAKKLIFYCFVQNEFSLISTFLSKQERSNTVPLLLSIIWLHERCNFIWSCHLFITWTECAQAKILCIWMKVLNLERQWQFTWVRSVFLKGIFWSCSYFTRWNIYEGGFLVKIINVLNPLIISVNPYSPNFTFLYPLKTSENRRFSDVFRGYSNVTLGEYGLNSSIINVWYVFNTPFHSHLKGFASTTKISKKKKKLWKHVMKMCFLRS